MRLLNEAEIKIIVGGTSDGPPEEEGGTCPYAGCGGEGEGDGEQTLGG